MSRSDRIGRLLVLGAMGVTAVSIVVALVVEFGSGPTTTATLVQGVHRSLLVVAVPIAILVEGALFYAVWKFHDNDEPVPTPEKRSLELAWTLATGLVLVFVGVVSYQVLAQPAVTATAAPGPAADALEVDLTAHQWYWSVEYPDGNVTVERANRIVLPVDRPIRFAIDSGDVIHSFFVPELGLKQDAIPGQRNVLTTRVTETGEYRLYCAEYCGRGHSRMEATVVVVGEPEFEDWLASRGGGSASAASSPERSTDAGSGANGSLVTPTTDTSRRVTDGSPQTETVAPT